MPKTIILWLADMHSGSPASLYPGEPMILTNGPRGPSYLQYQLHKHWIEVLEYVAEMRKDADRLVVVNMGDAVEGLHHDSKQIVSSYLEDHKKIHEALMEECKQITKYDALYYVSGTPSHAGEDEESLSNKLKAERYSEGIFTHPILKKKVYNRLIYAAHHGPSAGKGAARGNALRNRLRQLDWQCRMTGQQVPDMVVWADKHDPHEEIYTTQDGHRITGYILPSWKILDEYMYRVDAFAFSRVGAMVSTHTDRGVDSEYLTIHIEQNKIGEL